MRVSDIYGGSIKAADLNGSDVTVTIRGGELLELEGKKRLRIGFMEQVRPLILNVTNAKTIISLHGDEATQWKGKQITLYPTTTEFGGKTVPCIRVRDAASGQPQQQQPAQQSPQQPQDTSGAVRF